MWAYADAAAEFQAYAVRTSVACSSSFDEVAQILSSEGYGAAEDPRTERNNNAEGYGAAEDPRIFDGTLLVFAASVASVMLSITSSTIVILGALCCAPAAADESRVAECAGVASEAKILRMRALMECSADHFLCVDMALHLDVTILAEATNSKAL
jgi:hypothetical protein